MKKFFLLFLLSIAIQSVAFSQDLYISSVEGKKSAKRYTTFSFSVTFRNEGTVNITKSTGSDVYLSTDNAYSANDYLIGHVRLGPINAGESSTVAFTSDSPSNYTTAPAGTYYLVVNVDRGKAVAETNETNNVFVEGGYVIENPDNDLYFTSFRIDEQTTTPHGEVSFNYSVADKSATRLWGSAPFTFYFSKDRALDANDVVADTRYSFLYPPGNKATSDVGDKLIVPGAIAPGSYYIIVKLNGLANGNAFFQEADMSNNTAVSGLINVKPANIDLDFSGQKWDAYTVATDGMFKLYAIFTITNRGTTPSSGHEFTVYATASRLSLYNLTANALYQKARPQVILPGQTISQSIEIAVSPTNPLMGDAFGISVKVNESGAITETNYGNNELKFTMGLSFGQMPVDHGIVNYTIGYDGSNTITDTDWIIPLNIQYFNRGTQTLLDYDHHTVLVRDLDHNYVTSGIYSPRVDIPPGETRSGNTRLDLLKRMPVGTYILEVSGMSYPGFNFVATFNVVPTVYSLGGNIRGEDGVPITKGELFLYKKNAQGVVSIADQCSFAYSNFNFIVGPGAYALYVVPDETEFSAYVPTVMTKSLVLGASSFANVSANKTMTFDVLKANAVDAGSRFIEGNIIETSTSTTGRSATPTNAIMSANVQVVVVLFSESGDIIAHTKSDETGHYIFGDLPAGNYQVLPVFSFDHIQPEAPTLVDLTRLNARVDYTVEKDTIISRVKEILLKQMLTFSTLPTTKYKAAPFKLDASSDTNLPIEYISSDTAIAEIDGDTVFLVGVGEVTITAVQTGDETRQPASVPQRLIVGKADQIISFDLLPAMTYNDAPFALPEFTSAGLSVVYTSSNEAVAQIVDGKISITGAGEAMITAQQEGNALYLAAELREQNLVVSKDNQAIPFEVIPIQIAKEFLTLPEYSSAGLPIRYTSDNEVVATIADNVVTILESGETTITATQEGDENYEAAPSIQQLLRVAIVLGIEEEPSFLTIGPNPTTGKLKISSRLPIRNVSITDITGRPRMLTLQDSELDICSFAPGIYMLMVQASDKIEMLKIVKE